MNLIKDYDVVLDHFVPDQMALIDTSFIIGLED